MVSWRRGSERQLLALLWDKHVGTGLPRPADFGAVISYGTAVAPMYIFDWVYLPSGGAALWTVNVINRAYVSLMRFDQTSHVWTQAANYTLLTGNGATAFRAMWAVSTTAFQAFDGNANQLWQFSISGVAPVLISTTALASSYVRLDGAQCLSA
ncbi:hypothetical protein BU23DRAFT_653709, partial [Bimuria novae-zelandiae CBS 107.79]